MKKNQKNKKNNANRQNEFNLLLPPKEKLPKGILAILAFIPISIIMLAYYSFTRTNFVILGYLLVGRDAKIAMIADIIFLTALFVLLIRKSRYGVFLLFIDSILPFFSDAVTYFARILPTAGDLKLHLVYILLILQSIALFWYAFIFKKYTQSGEISNKKDLLFAIFYTASFVLLLILSALIWGKWQ